ncbi:hypothetical protein ACFWP7_32845 [Streptomyces sp. NPDC058470]|uniref:TetR/AcrR family transcriptional regulator n=1 Tax=Streptomyces sp. NPDC058470 TaxID=3346515 RepID=UPI00365AEB81
MTFTSVGTAAEARAEATQALISAGRTLFTRRGYRQTDFADLARTAGLEPEFARELLPDKAAVFGALIERTVKVAGLLGPAVAEGVDEDLPTRLARAYLTLWEPGEEESPLIEVYRVALSDKEASAVLRECISDSLNTSVGSELATQDAELRTALFGAQLADTAIVRHLVGAAPLTSADIETVIETVTPSLRHTLLGPDSSRRSHPRTVR